MKSFHLYYKKKKKKKKKKSYVLVNKIIFKLEKKKFHITRVFIVRILTNYNYRRHFTSGQQLQLLTLQSKEPNKYSLKQTK